MSEGRNVGIGNKRDIRYQHGYLKTADRSEQLPERQHRARFDIRLAGAGLPPTTIAEWAGFKFGKLSKHMTFRKEDDNATQRQQMLNAAGADLASHRKQLKRHAARGIRAHILPADDELNTIVRDRLRYLAERWKREHGAKKSGGIAILLTSLSHVLIGELHPPLQWLLITTSCLLTTST